MKSHNNKDKQKSKHKHGAVIEIANILEELASALVFALLIIGFVVQPFIIPTGSMAETLKGAHFRLCCPQCGYSYDHNYQDKYNRVPSNKIYPSTMSRCPGCGFYNDLKEPVLVAKGDKILAMKFLYPLVEPRQWDVVVFKNPVNPGENYIKRLIGKPGEKVEIIEGDVYINDEIARKPPRVQNEMWMIVYDSDFVPVRPQERKFNNHRWRQPLQNYGNSHFRGAENGGGRFVLNSSSPMEHRLVYDTDMGNNFRADYAYNKIGLYGLSPVCSDLMVRFNVEFKSDSTARSVGAGLRKYQRYYKARVDSDGRMIIARADRGREEVLAEKLIDLPNTYGPILVSFSNVDHMLTFKFADEKLSHDLGKSPLDAGVCLPEADPEVEIIGSGELEVSHVAIYRDTYYASKRSENDNHKGQATQGDPLQLAEDEFFVLGDNSPASSDGRWWEKPGIGNNGKQFRVGIVPREYLLGKAFVVFWPSGFRPFDKFPFRMVPNMREIRLIYGGSDKDH